MLIGFRERLVEERPPAHCQIDGVGIAWAIVQATLGFGVHQLYLESVRARRATTSSWSRSNRSTTSSSNRSPPRDARRILRQLAGR